MSRMAARSASTAGDVNAMPALVALSVLAFSGALLTPLPGGSTLQKLLLLGLASAWIVTHVAVRFHGQALRLIWPFVAYLLLAAASAAQLSGSVVYTLAALQPVLLGLFFYIAFVTSDVSTRQFKVVRAVVYAVVTTQFIFSLVKLVVHGVDEKVLIGTMSHTAGQLGFLLPAVAVPLLVFFMTPHNRVATFLLIAAMFVFGVINEKRSVIFLLPVLLVASLFVNRLGAGRGHRQHGKGSIAAGVLIAAAGIGLGIYAIPSLNVGSAYGGEISVVHAYDYAIDYLTMDYGSGLQGTYEQALADENVQVGRIIVWLDIVRWLIASDTTTLLFGAGFGAATPSEWIQQGSDPLFAIIGSRGAISGAGLATVETGIVGVALLGGFFLNAVVEMLLGLRRSQSSVVRRWFKTVLVLQLVFWYDFFFYSTSLLRTMPMPMLFFAVLASLPLARKLDPELARREALPDRPAT